MIKVLSMMKRKEGVSFEEFSMWALNVHPKLAKNLPLMKRYTVNLRDESDEAAIYDAVNELIFETEVDFKAAFASQEGAAAGADAAKNCGSRTRVLFNEHIIF